MRILALCEIDYDLAAWDEQRKKARRDVSVSDPGTTDAKHPVNRLLARRGVPTHFIATAPAPRTGKVTQLTTAAALTDAVRKDHPGHSALGDLLRSGGIINSRIGEALAHGRHGLASPHAFVGLHLREQKATADKRHLIYTLAALVPVSGASQWRMLGDSWQPHPVTGATGWMTYTEADVAFRAHDLTEGTRATAHDARVPAAVNQPLRQLKPALGATPYVLFVSGESCRSIWPGLANKHLDRAPDPDGTIEGRVPLPGPPDFKPAAIVRITPGSGPDLGAHIWPQKLEKRVLEDIVHLGIAVSPYRACFRSRPSNIGPIADMTSRKPVSGWSPIRSRSSSSLTWIPTG